MDYSFDLQAEHGDRFPSAYELGIARQEGYRAADIRSNPIRGLRRVTLRRTQCEQMSSGLPLKADIARYGRHVSNVPTADLKLMRRSVRDPLLGGINQVELFLLLNNFASRSP
jgi:hypothetical protein